MQHVGQLGCIPLTFFAFNLKFLRNTEIFSTDNIDGVWNKYERCRNILKFLDLLFVTFSKNPVFGGRNNKKNALSPKFSFSVFYSPGFQKCHLIVFLSVWKPHCNALTFLSFTDEITPHGCFCLIILL